MCYDYLFIYLFMDIIYYFGGIPFLLFIYSRIIAVHIKLMFQYVN